MKLLLACCLPLPIPLHHHHLSFGKLGDPLSIFILIHEFGDDGERWNAHAGAIGRASLLGLIITRIQD
ncbi:hypothetical protein PAHAL_2G109600 [Panicum hallii]|jgi:hypothetical protein|uniref:Uncharacterized protein n=1 Tax=Panicum hallii TaxID=206008 RepID=A0A2T8KNM6_9POAL|nr:hypothetical protein PAHAL_2G109600 [Panicum hallii]